MFMVIPKHVRNLVLGTGLFFLGMVGYSSGFTQAVHVDRLIATVNEFEKETETVKDCQDKMYAGDTTVVDAVKKSIYIKREKVEEFYQNEVVPLQKQSEQNYAACIPELKRISGRLPELDKIIETELKCIHHPLNCLYESLTTDSQ